MLKLSALKHIHNHGIVHRDIKPSNILAYRDRDYSRVCLIDFGLARPTISGTPKTIDLAKERMNVVGTLAYASLNAYKGIDLNPRDDLESLSFVLLSLLRGSLPWHNLCDSGTAVGRIIHIRRKMENWTGARLAEGHPTIFGELLDYARGLGFNQSIDYDRFIDSFHALEQDTTASLVPVDVAKSSSEAEKPTPASFPVEKGQLVLLQLDIPVSVEGYTTRHENTSYKEDSLFSSQQWISPFRPAIVVSTECDHLSRHVITAIPCSTSLGDHEVERVPLLEAGVNDPTLANFDCYAFPRAVKFFCSPQQPLVPTTWKVSEAEKLTTQFARRVMAFNWDETRNPNPDIRHDTRIYFQSTRFYANIVPLEQAALNTTHLNGTPIDWEGRRGWFDECVKVARRRGWEDGECWTGLSARAELQVDSEDSYSGFDTRWDFRQQERDMEQSLPDEESIEIPEIDQIIEE
ncbi:hypothetical protein CVT24_011125 [Panaeolus cyanescens]|uniref:Protein kinase domain-containing protein n=1 Tax=Panaeolus cyanescens TaxID=181874 RepID=A0A409YGA1_9AGAR|nr:hypothetical protein CVT24_011125 [Panaeolus cyanescens]